MFVPGRSCVLMGGEGVWHFFNAVCLRAGFGADTYSWKRADTYSWKSWIWCGYLLMKDYMWCTYVYIYAKYLFLYMLCMCIYGCIWFWRPGNGYIILSVCMSVREYECIYICVCIWMWIWTYIHVHIYVHVCVYAFVCVYTSTYNQTYICTDRYI